MKSTKKRLSKGTNPLLQRQSIGANSTGDLMTPSDGTLIKQCRKGDMDAFGQIVEKYQDRLFNAMLKMVGHYDDAQEITQEAFFRALRGLKGFREKSSFYTWLFRIAMNLAINQHRRSARVQFTSLQSQKQGLGRQADGIMSLRDTKTPVPDQQAQLKEQYENACRLLMQLKPDARAVVILRDIEQLDYATIAKVLEVPPGTVKSRLARARMTLRQQLTAKNDAIVKNGF